MYFWKLALCLLFLHFRNGETMRENKRINFRYDDDLSDVNKSRAISAGHGDSNPSLPDLVLNWTNSNRPLKLQEILPWHYDKLKPPRQDDGHAVVRIKLSVLAMRSVNDRDMTYEMDVFLHRYWTDIRIVMPERYKQPRLVLDNRWKDSIWTPDFFKNARDGKMHNIIIPYTYLVLYNNSEIFLASRLTLKLNCMMDLTSYPHDEQECEVVIMSLTHTNESLILVWKDFEITRNILLPQFTVTHHSHGTCDQIYDIGVFSCIIGKIRMTRRLGFFLINKFVPSILIVLVSFATFWIPPTAYPARVSLTVTSVLTIVTQQLASSANAPDVSYITALNIWMMGCIAFVFGTLLEYTLIVAMINSSRMREHTRMSSHRVNTDAASNGSKSPTSIQLTKFGNSSPIRHIEDDVKSRSMVISEPTLRHPGYVIDRASRAIFPAFLLVFILVYWGIFANYNTT